MAKLSPKKKALACLLKQHGMVEFSSDPLSLILPPSCRVGAGYTQIAITLQMLKSLIKKEAVFAQNLYTSLSSLKSTLDYLEHLVQCTCHVNKIVI